MRNYESEPVVFSGRPVMFRAHPIRFIILASAIIVLALAAPKAANELGSGRDPEKVTQGIYLLAGVIGASMVVWWLSCWSTCLIVTDTRTIWRRGIIARHTREVRHQDVRFVEVRQGIADRIFGIGQINVGSAGHGGTEIEARGFLTPNKIKMHIDRHR